MEGIMIDRPPKFGAVIRSARLERGMSQQALADAAGVSRAWLARFEAGHRRAELEQVLRVLSALGLALSVSPRTYSAGEQAVLDAFAARSTL